MRYMNDYDLHFARVRFGRGQTPNRLALAIVVDNLAQWADQNSDGWAYWPKPVQAAEKAIILIESRTSRENNAQERFDISDAELSAAVRPIRSFLTNHKARTDHCERILRAVDAGVTA